MYMCVRGQRSCICVRGQRSCICVLEVQCIHFASVYDFSIGVWKRSDSWVFFIFHFIREI